MPGKCCRLFSNSSAAHIPILGRESDSFSPSPCHPLFPCQTFPKSDNGQADEFMLTIVVDHIVLQLAVRGLLGLTEAQVEDVGLGVVVNPDLGRKGQ